MSKLTKLFFKPRQFFEDALRKRLQPSGLDGKDALLQAKGVEGRTNGGRRKGAGSVIEGERDEKELAQKGAAKAAEFEFPTWYNVHHNRHLIPQDGKPAYLYLPWIAEHGDALIPHLEHSDYHIIPFDIFHDIKEGRTRFDIRGFAAKNPGLYRRMILRRLIPLRGQIAGFIFSFDWYISIRMIVSACRELGIPTILIPHESVFVDRDKYYCDLRAGVSLPSSDTILAWGSLQADIFTERGYPRKNIQLVGTPKFDLLAKPFLSKATFCQLFGLQDDRPIVLFATQPLDSQLDQKMAKACQVQAINDLLDYIERKGWQLLIRMPPSREDVLGEGLTARVDASHCAAVDDASCYLVSPAEALTHCDMVASVNSTMLFEGILRGKPSVAVNYTGTPSAWEQAGIPVVRASGLLPETLDRLASNWTPPTEGIQWAANMYSIGKFDNGAGARLRATLKSFAEGTAPIPRLGTPGERVLGYTDRKVDIVGIASMNPQLAQVFKQIVKARTAVDPATLEDKSSLLAIDLFVQWAEDSDAVNQSQREFAGTLQKETVYFDRGFIGSLGNDPVSLVADTASHYYDARRRSSLISLLESGQTLEEKAICRSGEVIAKLVESKISADNLAPILPLEVGRSGKRKILLLDQRKDDPTVEAGLAGRATFSQMLQQAVDLGEDCDIIVKVEVENGYLAEANLKKYASMVSNLTLIDFEINMPTLISKVDEVWVVTSGFGLEALVAKKSVRCFGTPFYAGWGLTNDVRKIPERTRKLTLEELFHWVYIHSSRYLKPGSNRIVSIEEIIDEVIAAKRCG